MTEANDAKPDVTPRMRVVYNVYWIISIIVLLLFAVFFASLGTISFKAASSMVLLCAFAAKYFFKSRKEPVSQNLKRSVWAVGLCFGLSLSVPLLLSWKTSHDCESLETPADAQIKACTSMLEHRTGPSRLGPLANRGVALSRTGQQEAALKDLNEAFHINPNHVGVLVDRANAYRLGGHDSEALTDLNHAILIDPASAEARIVRALVYVSQKNYGNAELDASRVLEVTPGNAAAYLTRGVARDGLHEYDDAIADFDAGAAIAAKTGDNETRAALIAARGDVFFAKGLDEKAIQDAADAIAADPDSHNGFALQASVLFSNGDYSKAAESLTQAMRIQPEIAEYAQARGQAELYGGQTQNALADFKKAVELLPTDPYNILWLHFARKVLGENDEIEFETNASKATSDKWPSPVLELFRGKSSAEEVAAAANAGELPQKIDQTCEAAFYIGKFYLLQGSRDAAKSSFEDAKAHCPKDFSEFGSTEAELRLFK
jgi:lipoprotein NlpI